MVTKASTIESVDHASSRTRGEAREERLSPGGGPAATVAAGYKTVAGASV